MLVDTVVLASSHCAAHRPGWLCVGVINKSSPGSIGANLQIFVLSSTDRERQTRTERNVVETYMALHAQIASSLDLAHGHWCLQVLMNQRP